MLGISSQYRGNSADTCIGDVVVFEIITSQLLVLHHAEFNSLKDFFIIVELVVSKVDLLE